MIIDSIICNSNQSHVYIGQKQTNQLLLTIQPHKPIEFLNCIHYFNSSNLMFSDQSTLNIINDHIAIDCITELTNLTYAHLFLSPTQIHSQYLPFNICSNEQLVFATRESFLTIDKTKTTLV